MVKLKMTGMWLVILTVILYNTGHVRNEILFLKDSVICKDDVCMSENHENKFETTTKNPIINKQLSQDFVFKNSTKNLIKIKYLNPDIKKTAQYKSGNNVKFLKEAREFETIQSLSSTLEKAIAENTESETEIFNTTTVTEATTTEKNISETTTEVSINEKTSTPSTKSYTSTTQVPHSKSEIFLLQNSKKGKTICFCDLSVNQCDINCCCDSDCSLSHFKVFTKCDDDSPEYDTNYCFRSNFIFQNNTSHKVVENKGGLFCIVRDNLEVSLSYQTRQLITTLDAFNKSLPQNLYSFSYKSLNKSEFTSKDYQAGSLIWTVDNEEIKPFAIPAPSLGLLCLSQLNVRYMIDEETLCSHQNGCGKKNGRHLLERLRHLKVISNPTLINKSSPINASKICEGKSCLGITTYLCQSSENGPICIKVNEKANLPDLSCWNIISKIQYQIWHNGSKGIITFEAYIWLRNTSGEEQFMQTTEVKFYWWGSSKKIFKRSGNPGYLTGKPILAGRKVFYTVNETSEKKEAIEMSLDSRDWLSIFGSEKGICSSKTRTPINFRENSQYMCSIKLNKDNFGKDKCTELQNNIFKLLIGDDFVNATKDNYYNKFVATFGNSRVEETGDWVQVLIDLFPIISSQTGFRSNYYHLICKNIITDLYIDIAYSNIGSFLTPQAKILGVSYRLGKHKDLIFNCDTSDCESQSTAQYFKITSVVNFVDLTTPALDAFAEPLTLETRLPHDFFYPFFSKSPNTVYLNMFALVFSLSALL